MWNRWHIAGRRMPAEMWTAGSGLGDWTVRELYAHVSRGVSTLADLIAQPLCTDEPELSDAAAYFAALRPLGKQGAAQVAQAARIWAAERADEVLVEAFHGQAGRVLAALSVNGNNVVRSIAGTIRLSDFAVTRILEATVHLLDLGAVVAHAAGPTPDALHRTVDVLTDLFPPADFVLAATGRSSSVVLPVLT
ncbi:uncharacterized protein (TIGR03083 family) [Kibdelosporangium banguiense]|uniref:Uncharacterized protein (TIGR03083 family) n=1 Tax=Kibdelosporangium banguiense TaxID=1365924 RepID=A0ABS4TUA8_9PSEU|nr:maleylpyruvate isomerase N-terminal domain-containing protein [Kibdelosporangium banguiense]MBP2327970.1 uncharacterized protein (TIGR03083 family) [Kibdelosporangium banguiense]